MANTPNPETEADARGDGREDVEDGPDRYLYALVDADRGDPAAFEAAGVEEAPVRVVTVGDVGAVVHDCDGLYDSDDAVQVRAWLLAHQRVVDEASAAFGTPLPVRFDTVIEGGDAALAAFVRPAAETVRSHLERFRGRREYRISVRWDPEPFEAEMRRSDERLREVADEVDAADSGTAFLREKQYDKRLRELRGGREQRLEADLRERVEPVVVEATAQEPGGRQVAPSEAAIDDGRERVASLTVLAATDAESTLGDRLDAYVDAHDVEVRFTGPWPPYSFAPELSP